MSGFSIIVLAGGLGTRLRSSLPSTPKVLAPVNGKPFLSLLLEEAARCAPDEIILCLAHEAGRIRAAIGENFQGIPVLYSIESEPMGTGGAIRLGLETSRQPWSLILNGDSLCRMNWQNLVAWYTNSVYPEIGLVATFVQDASRFGKIELAPNSKVESFHEKVKDSGPGTINAGIYLVPRESIITIPSGRPVSWEMEILPKILPSGIQVFVSPGPFIDIGTPESYLQAAAFFENSARHETC